MAKRHLEDTDDSEEPPRPSGSKRPRFDRSAPQVREFYDTDAVRAESNAKRKGKQRAADDMDVDGQSDAFDSDNAAEIEKEVRESIHQRKNQPGVRFDILPSRHWSHELTLLLLDLCKVWCH